MRLHSNLIMKVSAKELKNLKVTGQAAAARGKKFLNRFEAIDEMTQDFEGKQYRVVGALKNTDKIMNDTFWVGVHPSITSPMIEFVAETIRKNLKR